MTFDEDEFVYDLDRFIAPILRKLPSEILYILDEDKKIKHHVFTILYIKGKLLYLYDDNKKTSVKIYHLKQYFPEREESGSLRLVKELEKQDISLDELILL